ncbi:hypothetical protein, partial [Mycobacterium marinum]
HEDLSVIGVCVVTTPIPEVLTYFPLATPFTTSLGVTTRAVQRRPGILGRLVQSYSVTVAFGADQ